MRRFVVLALLVPMIVTTSLARADSWPERDGVPLLTGEGGTLLRGSAGELWIARATRGCPSVLGAGLTMLRGRMTIDGVPLTVTGFGDTVDCTDPGNPLDEGTAWSGDFMTDDRGHLYHSIVYTAHFSSWFAFRDGDGHVSRDAGYGASSGHGCVFTHSTNDYGEFGDRTVPMRVWAYDANGLRWSTQLPSQSADGFLLSPDDRGGVLAAWKEYGVNGGPATPPYRLAYLDRTGVSRWVTTFDRWLQGAQPDGAGGALVVGTGTTEPSVVFHVLADGTFDPAWVPGGVPAFADLVRQTVADGAGGMLVESISSNLLHVTSSGLSPGWPAASIVLPGTPEHSRFVADGNGGAWLAWSDTAGVIRYRHVFRDLWISGGDDGLPLTTTGGNALIGMLGDSLGGAFLAWNSSTNGAQVLIGHVPAESRRLDHPLFVRGDTTGGVISLEWQLLVDGFSGRVERRVDDGAWSPWRDVVPDMNGRIAAADPNVAPGHTYCYHLVDRSNEANASASPCWSLALPEPPPPPPTPPPVAWTYAVARGLRDSVLLAWAGVPDTVTAVVFRQVDGVWTVRGRVHATAAGRVEFVDRDVRHGAHYCYRVGDADDTRSRSRDTCLVVLPFAATLVTGRASADAIALTWDVGPLPFAGKVQRSDETTPWTDVAMVTPSNGVIAFRDTGLVAHHRYCYRLVDLTDLTAIGGESCIVTTEAPTGPAAFSLAPSPANDDLRIRWIAERPAAARIVLYDLQGRALMRGTFASGAAGARSATLALDGLSSGIYLVELRHDGRVDRARAVVVR